jgi:hypothetical protein
MELTICRVFGERKSLANPEVAPRLPIPCLFAQPNFLNRPRL